MANISRDTFDKTKHYRKVLLQQGVPWLDADFNEQQDHHSFYLRKMVGDCIGDGTPDDGFKIMENSVLNGGTGDLGNKFLIKIGSYYVSGYCGIFESTQEYSLQDDWLSWDGAGEPAPQVPFAVNPPALTTPPSGTRTDKVILCIWENEVDSVEDGGILDPTLLVETSRRLKVMGFVYVTDGPLPTSNTTHQYELLATIQRTAGKDSIEDADITDERVDISQVLSALDEIRDEVVEARDSDVYGAHASLDARIESGDSEVNTARTSSVYGAHASLNARIASVDGEVNTARGTRATLDTRLDIAMDNAGYLNLIVSEDGSSKEATTMELDFKHGIDVTAAGSRVVDIAVDESELNAALIPNVPAGKISSVTIQGAINELDNEKIARDGTQGLTGNWDAGSWNVRAETFTSDIATGSPPLVVASTTKVVNLNADMVDGITFPNTIVSILSDHNKANHDSLGINAATLESSSKSAVIADARTTASVGLLMEVRSGSDPSSPANGQIWLRTDL